MIEMLTKDEYVTHLENEIHKLKERINILKNKIEVICPHGEKYFLVLKGRYGYVITSEITSKEYSKLKELNYETK